MSGSEGSSVPAGHVTPEAAREPLLTRVRDGLVHQVVALVAGTFMGVAVLLSRLRRRLGRPRWKPIGRVALIGTFYNTGWFLSHARPVARSGAEKVVVITDEPTAPVDRVRVVCAPSLARFISRPLVKLGGVLLTGLRDRPDVYMGYHIVPNAVIALIGARLFGRVAIYQMTGGPTEIIGGGVGSENLWLSRLRRPSPFLERAALAMAREFDLVVVRGTRARRFLTDRGLAGRVAVIPGSVDESGIRQSDDRSIDLIFVGRLTEIKRPLEFVQIVGDLAVHLPDVRAVIVGDGPLADEARKLARERGVADNIEFRGKQPNAVAEMGRARVFVLTSRTEGLSIAMAEAMMAGAVPVVARVGDLADLVEDNVTGFVVEPGDRATFVAHARGLLEDRPRWERLSRASRDAARAYVGLDHVAALWSDRLRAVVSDATEAAATSPSVPREL
jgi:L-malate glycosyltransferase